MVDPSRPTAAGQTEPTAYWLAIDQGTTSTRATLFDQNGQVVTAARRPVNIQRGPQPGYVEQDAHEIAASVDDAIREVIGAIDDPQQIRAAGLATQRSSVVAWDRATGKPLSPVLSWQDTRCRDAIDAFGSQLAAEIKQRTGLPLTAHYGASKIGWLLRAEHSAAEAISVARKAGRLAIGPLASFVAQSMLDHPTNQKTDSVRATLRAANVDHANGGRTQLMNVATGDWDPWLLNQFDVPAEILPGLRPTDFDYGRLQRIPARLLVMQGDQTAAIYGQGGLEDDLAHINLGTGGFLLAAANASTSHPKLLRSIARSQATSQGQSQREYLLEGTINGCGSALDWAAQKRAIEVNGPNIERWLNADDDTKEVPIFLNTIGGLGSPFWCDGPGADWTVPPVNDDVAMLAVLESILFLVVANLQAMQTTRTERVGKLGSLPPIQRLRVTGGLSKSDDYCQRLADITGLPVSRTNQATEATSRGVAWLAADCPPSWHDQDSDRDKRLEAGTPARGSDWTPNRNAASKRLQQRCEKLLATVQDK